MLDLRPTEAISLRPYQADAVDLLRECVRRGLKRPVLYAPTGAGKTVIASHLLREANAKGSYALFLVDRVELVKQTSATLDRYGIPHGIVQGINERWMPRENVQVCSIQTLERRVLPRRPSLVIYDEAHCSYRKTLRFIADNPEAVAIGLTATPFTKGMGDHWDTIVNVASTRTLIDAGNLIEPLIYVARSPQDSELAVSGMGEFTDASATGAGIKIIGDVVAEWIAKTCEHFGGPAKTIVFSPTVEHGRELCAAFADAGFNFQQVSYLDRNEAERDAKIAEFRRPDSIIHGLVSCGVLTKGFDVPDVLVGIGCKPYRKSLSSHMQEIGRIMRPAEGKAKALWLCHSGNVERFALDTYDVWENGAGDLSKATKRDSTPRKREPGERAKVVCPECSGALYGDTCRSCGWQRPARSGIHSVDGSLHAFDPATLAMATRPGLRAECLNDPRGVWSAALSYCLGNSRYGEDKARRWAAGIWHGVYPDAKLPAGWYSAAPGPISDSALGLIDREVKRFRQSKRRAA
ncbi:ATP-dependent helicase [Paracoccus suum]|uniref:ATP-dependent helicase n=2 Tax=Paracoccus suum TaxID=2259340 RepID=A0A344PPA8_9RHOB|nr:ATP-dependent helicase [Paracoccus suum]